MWHEFTLKAAAVCPCQEPQLEKHRTMMSSRDLLNSISLEDCRNRFLPPVGETGTRG